MTRRFTLKYPLSRRDFHSFQAEAVKLNLVGSRAQEILGTPDTGLELGVASKIIANVILEWNHFLPKNGDFDSMTLFPFLTLWTPVRFGAVSSTPPRRLFGEPPNRYGRLFLQDLEGSHLGRAMRLRVHRADRQAQAMLTEEDPGHKSDSGGTRVIFAALTIDGRDEVRRDEVLSDREVSVAEELATVFARLYQRCGWGVLNALATSRDFDTTVASVDSEIVLLFDDLTRALRAYSSGHTKASSFVQDVIEKARACPGEMRTKQDNFLRIVEIAGTASGFITSYELGQFIIRHTGDPSTADQARLDVRRHASDVLFALVEVVAAALREAKVFSYTDSTATSLLENCSALQSFGIIVPSDKLSSCAFSQQHSDLCALLLSIVDATREYLLSTCGIKVVDLERWYSYLKSPESEFGSLQDPALR